MLNYLNIILISKLINFFSEAAHEELEACDLCLVVGTSSVVYPAAMFAPQVSLTPPPPSKATVPILADPWTCYDGYALITG